ncbi:MAG: HNH endonuclease signature motif containing protein [Acidimicrobiia bacterium]|nr:MAG: HNH endonuclease signature motif containing protein [Acidimicrobiia bacterium]
MFDSGYETIPAGLDAMEPGATLGVLLSAIDVTNVSPHDRIPVLRALDRMESFYAAHRYQAMAAVVDVMDDDKPERAAESAAAEIRAALHLTRRASDTELSFALDLRRRLPRVWTALADGEIDLRRAKTITYATIHLATAAARDVVERVIEAAPHLTTGQLRARIDRLCLEADPEAAQERYDYAVENRRVVTERTDTGTANLLGLELPPHRVAAIARRINHLARTLKTTDETRTMDQLRADIYLDLLKGASPDTTGAHTSHPVTHVHIDLDTLAGLSTHPGELDGYGPVIADIAKQVIEEQEDAQWRYTVTDTVTGHTINDGITRRRPTATQRRTVEARHPTCIFPGCRMPAVDCDLDHRIRWADGGETTNHNLAPLCRHDHIIKDDRGWTYRPLNNGDYQWTSRLGHTYTTSGTPP